MSDSDSDFGDCDFIGGASTNIQDSWNDAKFDDKTSSIHQGKIEPVKKSDEELSTLTAPTQSKQRKVSLSVTENEDEESFEMIESDKEEESKEAEKDRENLTPPSSPGQELNASGGRGRGRGRKKAVRGANRTRKTLQALKRLENMEKSETKNSKAVEESPILKLWKKKRGGKEAKNVTTADSNMETISIEDEDLVLLKVKFQTVIHRLEVNKSDRLGRVLDQFAASQDLRPGQIFVEDVQRDQIVSNLNLSVASILHAKLKADEATQDSEDLIEIKVQSNTRKDIVSIKINKIDQMSVLMTKYAQIKETEQSNIRFFFDGEQLDSEETGESLDLEGGEIFDAHF